MRPVHLDPGGLRLAPYRGGFAVLGPSLDVAFPDSRPPYPLHITLLTPAEAKAHPPPKVSLEHIYALGIVTRGQVTFAVVVWVHGNAARRSLGLGQKDFHVTLSATDAHDMPKGISQLPLELDAIVNLGLDGLDHVFLAAPSWQAAIAERMVIDYPASYKGYVRLAAVSPPKVACLALVRAATLNPTLRTRVGKELRKRSAEVHYGPTMSEAELASIPDELLAHLSHPWPDLSTGFWPHPADSSFQASRDHRLPKEFSFVYPRICASAAPGSVKDTRALEAVGVTHVLTLAKETWLPPEWFDASFPDNGYFENIHVPVAKGQAPTLAEMDGILAATWRGGTWLVHGAEDDDGRTVTVLACLVATVGEDGSSGTDGVTPKLDAQTAVALVRQVRPKSGLSEKQERFVADWVAHRWSLQHLPEPTTPLEISGDISPRVLVLIGHHGAGKSWFAKALAKRCSGSVMVVCEDHGESRASRLREFAGYAGNGLASFVVLDRCNLTREKRAPWLSACDKAVAVWFDYDELCYQRAEERIDDSRTRFLRGIGQTEAAGEVEPPALDDFAGVLRVPSFLAAREALDRLAPVSAVDFPPTALIDIDTASVLRAEPQGTLVVEEKLRGTELRISLDLHGRLGAHPRGSTDNGQSDIWVAQNETALRRILDRDEYFPERFTLFGVLNGDSGPFFATDVYDRAAPGGPGFVSREILEFLLCGEMPAVPLIQRGKRLGKEEVLEMLTGRSATGDGRRDGLVVRWEERAYCFKRCQVQWIGTRSSD